MATAARPRPRPRPRADSVIKQGYLKKTITSKDFAPSAPQQLANSILQKIEPLRWYVFGVSYSIPYLEYYDKEETVFSSRPIKRFDLTTFKNLTYTLGRTNRNFTFCIFLEDEILELTAHNRANMVAWCRCIEVSLRNMGYRGRLEKDDHTYSAFPVKAPWLQEATPIVDDPEGIYSTTAFDDDHIYSDPLDAVDNGSADSTTPQITGADYLDDPEHVFASLYTVSRDTLTRDSQPIYDFGISPVDEPGTQITDASTSIKQPVDSGDGGLSESELQLLKPLESDTSEDSDFQTASFWMRNRKFSKDDSALMLHDKNTSRELTALPDSLYSTPPPAVPIHEGSNLHRSRNCFSMVVRSGIQNRSASPTLLELESVSHFSDLIDLYSTDTEKTVLKPVVSDSEVNNNVQETSEDIVTKPKLNVSVKDEENLSNGKKWAPDTCNALDGEYEDVLPGQPDSTVCNSTVPNSDVDCGDFVYETSWVVKARSNFKDSESCGLTVELPQKDAGNNECRPNSTCSTDSGSHDDGHNDVGDKHTKKKSGKRFFQSFKSSSKYKELPESLTALVSAEKHNDSQACNAPSRNCYATENGANELMEQTGNIYSDFPLDNETSPKSTETSPKSPVFDSDILKLAQEGQPNVIPKSSPVLPKRTNFRHSVKMPLPPPVQMADTSSESDLNTDCKMLLSSDLTDIVPCSTVMHKTVLLVAPPRRSKGKGNKSKGGKHMVCNNPGQSADESDQMPTLPPRNSDDMVPLFQKSSKDSSCEILHNTNEESVSQPTVQQIVLPKRNMKNTEAPPLPDFSEHPIQRSCTFTQPLDAPALPDRLGNQKPQLPQLPPRVRSAGADDIPTPLPPKRGIVRSATSLDETRREKYTVVRSRPSQLSVRQQMSAQSGGLTVMNLKQNQVDILRAEIESTGGLVMTIPKVHVQHGLAIVECFERLWIVGWDVKKFPRLYDKFHIGDEILAVNDVRITDLGFMWKLVKNVKADVIELTVRRLPNAKAYAIQRSAEGQALGFRREGGTAEIVYVDPNGLANRHGLMNKSTTLDGDGLCSWMLTEINNRPLNLFFKDQEIEHRLMAVGRDISIVVQPADFIRDLKKQLKKLRSYKDYLVQ